MKSFSKIINESVINFDKIEGVLDNFYDMGFELINNNDIGRRKGDYGLLFGCDISESDEYFKINMWSYSPDENYCYSCFLFSVKKRIRSFSDCDIYSKVIQEAELVRKRLNNCKVFWRLDSNTKGINTITGGSSDTEINFVILFYIVDTTKKIEIEERKKIASSFEDEIRKYKLLQGRFYNKWGIDDLTFVLEIEDTILMTKSDSINNEINHFLMTIKLKKIDGWKVEISKEKGDDNLKYNIRYYK